jgi:hypothetical protein
MFVRPPSRYAHRHTHNVRTVRMLAAVAVMSLVSACSEITEPVDARAISAGERAALSVTHAAVWNGHIVAIESQQVNSAGQTVCLALPSGNDYSMLRLSAFSGQDVNYAPCHYGATQQFVLSAWDAGFGASWVVAKPVLNTSVCVDIRGRTSNGGEHLQLSSCGSLNDVSWYQTFLFPVASFPSAVGVPLVGTICVRAGYTNFVLDVPLPTGVSGHVQQYLLNRGQNQLWRFKDIRSGQYFISPTGRPQSC